MRWQRRRKGALPGRCPQPSPSTPLPVHTHTVLRQQAEGGPGARRVQLAAVSRAPCKPRAMACPRGGCSEAGQGDLETICSSSFPTSCTIVTAEPLKSDSYLNL